MARRRGPTAKAVTAATNTQSFSAARVLAGPPKVEPGFPEPFSNAPALYATVKAVMVATEVLLRRKGDILDSAVRVRDLERLTEFYDDRYSVLTIDTGKTKGEVVPCTGDVWTDVNAYCFVGEDASNCNLTVEPGDTIQIAHCDIIYQYFGDSKVCLGSGGDGKYPHYDTVEADWVPQGSTSHTALQGREDPDSHPQAAITNLVADQASQNNQLDVLDQRADDTDTEQGVQDGRLSNLESWDATHDAAYNPHAKMTWKGDWFQTTYEPFDMAIDGAYVGVANKQTTDHIEPQDAGPAYDVYTGASPTGAITAKQLVVGQRYTWSESGKLNGMRVYTVTGNNYRIYYVSDPLGTPILSEVASQFTAENTGWQSFAIDPLIVYAGTSFDLYVAMEQPADEPAVWTADYNYTTPNNEGVPLSGQALHADKGLGTIRFHDLDNLGTDRSTALLALTPGDIIDAVGMRWAIQAAPSDQGTYVEIAVAPAQQGAPDGVSTFSFETVAAVPITVVHDLNFWLGDASVSGRYQIDGGTWTETDDQYSVDINVQPVTISPDWDVLPQGDGGGGTGGTFEGEHNDLPGLTAANAHPISAITDLETRLAALEATVQQLNQRIGACWFV